MLQQKVIETRDVGNAMNGKATEKKRTIKHNRKQANIELVEDIRQKLGLDQVQMSHALGLSHGAYGHMVQRRNMSLAIEISAKGLLAQAPKTAPTNEEVRRVILTIYPTGEITTTHIDTDLDTITIRGRNYVCVPLAALGG